MAPEAAGAIPSPGLGPRLTAIRVGAFTVHRLAAPRQSLHLTPPRSGGSRSAPRSPFASGGHPLSRCRGASWSRVLGHAERDMAAA